MTWLLVGCLVTPLITAGLVFLWPTRRLVRGGVSVGGSAVLALLGALLLRTVWLEGPVAAQMGAWPAPFGITLVADLLSAVMVLATGLTGLAVAIYALADIDQRRIAAGFDSVFQMLLTGVVGAFLTGDLFNLYVWFEVMLIASFALLVLGGERRQLDGAVKYVAINLVSTVLLLTAIGLLYGLVGSLNMADIHGKLGALDSQGLVSVVAVLFLIAFGIKAAVFPLFFWLPAAYHTPPIAIAAVFAGLMTKVGVYALIRVFTLIFPFDTGAVPQILMVTALLTMTVGVLGAIAHSDLRRILSFQVINSIGFMILGLALHTPLAIAAAIFYMVHTILVKTNLFMIAGVVGRIGGGFELAGLGGLYRNRPALALLFLLTALALIGSPPFPGFWAKVMVVEAGLDLGAYLAIAVVLAVSLLTFVPMIRIWSEAFWKAAPGDAPRAALPGIALLMTPIVALAALTLWIGLSPSALLAVADQAAAGILQPGAYIEAVLGPGAGPVAEIAGIER